MKVGEKEGDWFETTESETGQPAQPPAVHDICSRNVKESTSLGECGV
jgi:hypothetical protein